METERYVSIDYIEIRLKEVEESFDRRGWDIHQAINYLRTDFARAAKDGIIGNSVTDIGELATKQYVDKRIRAIHDELRGLHCLVDGQR